MKEAMVRVRDGNLFYKSKGRGEALLLLHSLGTSSEAWHHIIGPLAEKFSVYAIDLMGHGNSDKPDKNYEICDYANNVIQFMDALGISKARIIGNSIGSLLSLEISASSPQRIVKQVLVGCPTWETAWQRMEKLMFLALMYDAQGKPKPITMDDLILSFAQPSTEILEWMNNLRAKTGLWCKRALIAVCLYDIMPKLPMVSCPTLIVFGSKDILREKEQVLTRNIKGAEHVLIENAGHLPQIDAPGDFLKTVIRFL